MSRSKSRVFTLSSLLMLMLFVVFTFSANAQLNKQKWSSLGPDQPTIICLVIDPMNPAIIYAGTHAGIYKSTDSGENWLLLNSTTPHVDVVTIVVDPINDAVLYAASYYGITKSVDGGHNWVTLQPAAPSIFLQPRTIVVDPTDSNIVYITQGPTLFKSRDGGVTWSRFDFPELIQSFMGLAIDPQNHNVMYAGFQDIPADTTINRILKSNDGGQTWNDIVSENDQIAKDGLGFVDTTHIDIGSPVTGNSLPIYASGYGALSLCSLEPGIVPNFNPCKLLDNFSGGVFALDTATRGRALRGTSNRILFFSGGSSDTPAFVACPLERFNAISVDPTNSNIIYAAGINSSSDGAFRPAFLKSVDRGTTWNPIGKGLFASSINAITADPSTAGKLHVGASLQGLFKIADSSSSVTKSDAVGLEQAAVSSILFDPNNPNIALAGTSTGLSRSSDGGKNWSPISLPLAPSDGGFPVSSISAVAFGPSTPGLAYVAGNGFFSNLFRSTDSGLTWTFVTTLGRVSAGKCLSIDPLNSANILVGTVNYGILKTADGGQSWATVVAGGIDSQVYTLTRDPFDNATIYATSTSGLLKSIDGGTTWKIVLVPGTGRFSPRSALLDPNHPGTIYVGLSALYVNGASPKHLAVSGVFHTINGGISWFPLGNELSNLDINLLTMDSTTGSLYVGTSGGGIFRTQITSYRTGDVNHDGKIDILDLVTIANGLAGNVQLDPATADTFADGQINTQDLMVLAQYLAGNVKTLPTVPSN